MSFLCAFVFNSGVNSRVSRPNSPVVRVGCCVCRRLLMDGRFFTSFSLGEHCKNHTEEKLVEDRENRMVETSHQTATVSEDGSLSDSMSGGSEEKTIPFLKRLCDMLQENEGVISFIPGSRKNGQVILGRLVVHDRIEVEATVLPRYFNHSSFASLRRQLNYFSFVRLGKGRQRESTYINDGVVELDDILTLRRRSAGATGRTSDSYHQHQEQPAQPAPLPQPVKEKPKKEVIASPAKNYVDSIVPVVHLPRNPARVSKSAMAKRTKRNTKQTKKKAVQLPNDKTHFVSEDEQSQDKPHSSAERSVALDLTLPTSDPDVIEGCAALLGLSGKLWG